MGDGIGFRERVSALIGRTAFREPMGGHGTAPGLTDQDVAAALAMGRLRRPDGTPDWTDIGPEMAYGWACAIRHQKPDVCGRVDTAIAAEMTKSKRGNTNPRRWRIRLAVNAAYETLIANSPADAAAVEKICPKGIPLRIWKYYFAAAYGVLVNSAESALLRAEKALYREMSDERASLNTKRSANV